MSDEGESEVRAAYEAYGRGEVNSLLELVHPDLEWTYLDPSMENPQPQACHGREQLAWAVPVLPPVCRRARAPGTGPNDCPAPRDAERALTDRAG
jgi:ketosteroid isomerase-like protein